jgi:hypothetical protein
MKCLRIGCLYAATLVMLVCLALFLMPSAARRALPSDATEVHEHYRDARFGSDYVRCLKARVSRDGFVEFARRLNLTEEYVSEKHCRLELSWHACNEPWWNPPASLEGALFEPGSDKTECAMAKYENGYLYFVA